MMLSKPKGNFNLSVSHVSKTFTTDRLQKFPVQKISCKGRMDKPLDINPKLEYNSLMRSTVELIVWLAIFFALYIHLTSGVVDIL
jgi:hypothetical protein